MVISNQLKSLIFIFLIHICLFSSNVSGAEQVIIGQDTTLTNGNIVEYSGDAQSNGTSAYAQVIAGPYTTAISQAEAGVEFEILGYEDGPTAYLANLTFEFDYSITVNFDVLPPTELGGGSADAHINAYFFTDGFYDRINFLNDYVGSAQAGHTVVLSTQEPTYLHPGELLSARISLYAHADVYIGNSALAYVDANLKKVIIDFLPPPEATFSFIPVKSVLGESITFDATDSVCPEGQTCSYLWEVNDEAIGTGAIINKTFTDVGTHNIVLTITDQFGQTDVESREINFQPKFLSFPSALNFQTTITDGNSVTLPSPEQAVMIQNTPDATAPLNITKVELLFNDDSAFKIGINTCDSPVAPGGACMVSVRINEPVSTASLLSIHYDGQGSPRGIPVQQTLVKTITEKERELIKKAVDEMIKKFNQGGDGAIEVGGDINQFPPGIPGGTWFFGASNPNPGVVVKGSELETTLPTTVIFGSELAYATLDDGTSIPYLPYSLYENGEEDTGGLVLLNFLNLEDGDNWLVSLDFDTTFDIGDTPVPAFKFVMIKTNDQNAYGYDISYNVESDSICEIGSFDGSTNVFDILINLGPDDDNDQDVDGKDLIFFLDKAMSGDLSVDYNKDGEVNIEDLKIFLLFFGS